MKKCKKAYILMFELCFCICLIFTTVQATEPSSSVIFQGIDVSQWQQEIDFEQVANDDVQIVYIKSSEGTSYEDPYFETNYEGAKRNGLKVGFYHYLTARTVQEAEDEAQFFAATISGKSVDCKLAMDFESFGNLTTSQINEISQAFLNRLQQLTGKEVIIYSDVYDAINIFNKNLASKYPVWLAEYEVDMPGYTNWKQWEGFQYTSRGRVNGIITYVDLDKFTENVLLSGATLIPEEISKPESANSNTRYVVQSGNTLSGIAIKFGTSVSSLVKLNNIKNPNLIYVGQVLIIQTNAKEIHDTNHVLYTVKPGDTLTAISEKYGESISKIVELNEIKNPNLIYVGEILRIN